jgi:hypothetical protein
MGQEGERNLTWQGIVQICAQYKQMSHLDTSGGLLVMSVYYQLSLPTLDRV